MTSIPESRHSTKRRILRNTAANAVAQGASLLSTLVIFPLLLRAFGLSIYGVMALATSASSFAMLVDLGVSVTLTRIVAERNARADHEGLSTALFSAALIYGVIGIVVALAMFLLGWFGADIFHVTGNEADLLRTLLWIGALTQLWYWPASAARDGLLGLQRYDLASMVTLGMLLVDIAGTVFVLLAHRGPVVLVSIRAIEVVVASLINGAILFRILPGAARRIRATVADMREILSSGSSVFALQVAQVLSRQQTDKVVLGVFLGPPAVAIYEIASKLNSLVEQFVALTVSAVLPVAAELNAREDHEGLVSLFLRGTKLVATAIAPLVTILIAIAAPFIAAWCGPAYVQAVPLAQILLLSQVALPLYQLCDQVLIAKNKFYLWVPGGLTTAVVNIVFSVLLVKTIGLAGVAIGTLCAVIFEIPWYAKVFSKEMSLPIRMWLRRTAWPAYPLLVIPAALAFVGGRTVLGNTIIGLALVSGVAAGVYWLVMFFAGYSAIERADLLSILGRTAPPAEVV
jgi:O-antigen/teichoic acid export membrane protein